MNANPTVPTALPGHAEALYDRHVLGNYARAPLTLVRGRGTRVWDDRDRSFLDFTSGIAVSTLGHAHPRLVEAIARQAGTLMHVSNLFRNVPQAELSARLCAAAGPGRVVFSNSGAEANEFLIKLARLHGCRMSGGREAERFEIVTALNSFHGRTFGGMSATPQAKVQDGFRPLVPGFVHAPFNDLAAFRAACGPRTAAILVESIQGEGGIHPATPEFLRGLRALCDELGLLLLIDEVQCGIGRTGRFFAYEESEIVPDAIGMAKGLGGGFPIGAAWVHERHVGLLKPGMHGSTYAGSPLACAAALAVLDAIESEDLMGHVNALAPRFHAGLSAVVARHPDRLAEVRGRGFLVGVQLRDEEPAAVLARLREQRLLCVAAGGGTIRLLPPLNVLAEEIDEAVAAFARAFD